jgi:hypothetical protein
MIVSICYFSTCATYPFNRSKAIKMAKNYLSEKYNQKMKYLGTFSPLLDGWRHDVIFSPVDNDDLWFIVYVSYNLSDIRDNYFIVRFKKYLENYLREKMESIWKENSILIMMDDRPKKDYPINIDEKTNPKELEPYMGYYDIAIWMNYILDNKIIEEEASKILNALKIIKESNYEPHSIRIWYNNGKEVNGKHQMISFYKTPENNLPSYNTIYKKQELIEILYKYISK